jgi:hypothetical protein
VYYRSLPRKETNMPNQFWEGNSVFTTSSGHRKLYTRILPDKETICAIIFPTKETYMPEYFQTMKLVSFVILVKKLICHNSS